MAKPKPDWAITRVSPEKGLQIEVKAGMTVTTSEGDFRFDEAGTWILLPMPMWTRTLARMRQAEARMTGRGDGGPARN
jgi:hypothetical protein